MIKICSFSRYVGDIEEKLKENNISYSSEECLGRCDLCMTVPFVKIEHNFVIGNTLEELIENIKMK